MNETKKVRELLAPYIKVVELIPFAVLNKIFCEKYPGIKLQPLTKDEQPLHILCSMGKSKDVARDMKEYGQYTQTPSNKSLFTRSKEAQSVILNKEANEPATVCSEFIRLLESGKKILEGNEKESIEDLTNSEEEDEAIPEKSDKSKDQEEVEAKCIQLHNTFPVSIDTEDFKCVFVLQSFNGGMYSCPGIFRPFDECWKNEKDDGRNIKACGIVIHIRKDTANVCGDKLLLEDILPKLNTFITENGFARCENSSSYESTRHTEFYVWPSGKATHLEVLDHMVVDTRRFCESSKLDCARCEWKCIVCNNHHGYMHEIYSGDRHSYLVSEEGSCRYNGGFLYIAPWDSAIKSSEAYCRCPRLY